MIPGLADYSDEVPEVKEIEAPSATESPFTSKETTKPNKKLKKKTAMKLPKPTFTQESEAAVPGMDKAEKDEEGEMAAKKQKLSSNDLRPPQVRFGKQNVSTEDMGKYFSEKHLKEKSLLTKRKKSDPQ